MEFTRKAGEALLLTVAVLAITILAHAQEQLRLMPQLGLNHVESVAFSPNGRLLLIGTNEKVAWLLDAFSGKEIRSFKGHRDVINSVAFAPDGKLILTGSGDGTARLWDATSGRELRTFAGHKGSVNSVAFSPDGLTVVTAGDDKTARLWEVQTGQQIRSFEGHTKEVVSVAFSTDGRSVLTGSSDGTARLWDTATGKQIRLFDGRAGSAFDSVSSVAISPDGSFVLTGENLKARLWDAETGQPIRSFVGHRSDVHSVAFSPNGQSVLTGSWDGTVRIWDTATGKQTRSLTGQASIFTSAVFSPNGQYILTGSMYHSACLWNAETGRKIRSFEGFASPVKSVTFSPDGRYLLTGSVDHLARLWSSATGRSKILFEGHAATVSSVAISHDNHLVLTGSFDGTARLWDAATGKLIHILNDAPDSAHDTEVGADGHSVFSAHHMVDSVVFSPDGRSVLTGNFDGAAQLWDAASGQQTLVFAQGKTAKDPNPVMSVAFSPDGRLVLTGYLDYPLGNAELWDAATGAPLRLLVGQEDKVDAVAFSPDGRYLLTVCSDGTAWLRNAATGVPIRTFKNNPASPLDMVDSAAFSPDGRFVAMIFGDDTVRLWSVSTGLQVRVFRGHNGTVNSVAFSSDGRFVLTGGDDTTSRLWDVTTGKELATLISFGNGGWAVVDPHGRFDTSDLDGGAPLAWVVSSDPMRALPLEIFMRDYYTPRLLSLIVNGETLPPVRSIAEITNRVQPDVVVVSVSDSKTKAGCADVIVHASSHLNEKGQASGLEDLRLFRNGQLVGYREGPLKSGDFTFSGIQLPTTAKSVTFTAYAFNTERIKSATAEKEYVYVPGAAAKPRAWLLQIGVNHYEATGCELHGSANDAEDLSKVLGERLTARGLEVRSVVLVSTEHTNDATKAKIREVLARIAAQAAPDDVFFLSFSGHGYSDQKGQFYILPADVRGSCGGVTPKMLRTAISAEDLTEWLRPIDAGQMTFIIDACDSASSVESNDFKPGPMGSPGLGQLAYDKRMRILAASQPNQAARESSGLGHGLLSYALTELGLVKGEADWKPKDGKITVGEWLGFAANAVPGILQAGAVKAQRGLVPVGLPEQSMASAQIPAVFDFSRSDSFVLQ